MGGLEIGDWGLGIGDSEFGIGGFQRTRGQRPSARGQGQVLGVRDQGPRVRDEAPGTWKRLRNRCAHANARAGSRDGVHGTSSACKLPCGDRSA